MEKVKKYSDVPIVYSCSGSSSAAQMANYLAVRLDRKQLAEMSCIVGVGGNVKKLVKTATSGRKMVVIDGCPLECSKAVLRNHGLLPALHVELSKEGVKKQQHVDFDTDQAQKLLEEIEERMKEI